MERVKIGVLGTSDIAYRRFLPALLMDENFEYIGIASRDLNKTQRFIDTYGGKGYKGYNDLIEDSTIQAVYISLPPALHSEWAEKALKAGKHILVEKPFTTSFLETKRLITIAQKENLSIHENYAFLYHCQLSKINEIISSGDVGEVYLIRAAFGFPFRSKEDFRYSKNLGGGALLDCGGYPLLLAALLLGDDVELVSANQQFKDGYDVDLGGFATLINNQGQGAQISFGMDHSYKCELEVWGSKGTLLAPRVFTAPAEYEPELLLTINGNQIIIKIPKDNQFLNSIRFFYDTIIDESIRQRRLEEIIKQAFLVSKFIEISDKI